MLLFLSFISIPIFLLSRFTTIESIPTNAPPSPPPIHSEKTPEEFQKFPSKVVMSEKKNYTNTVGSEKFGTTVDLNTLRPLYLDSLKKEVENDKGHLKVNPKSFPNVKLLSNDDKKRILITGGAGFVGSHLVDRLMLMGHNVIVVDNFFTGSKKNIQHWVGHPNFEIIRQDVTGIPT